jgi:transposase
VPMLEGNIDHVIGVDTHCDAHAAAILNCNGGLLAQLQVPSSQAGYEELLSEVAQRAPGRRCWALEGTGCYGAGLASFLADHGEWVTEIDRPKRTGRTHARGRGCRRRGLALYPFATLPRHQERARSTGA